MSEPTTFTPEWMHDTQGADGWEWRMVVLLRRCAGDEAIAVGKATDFRLRALHQARERLFDAIAERIIQQLPEKR